MSQTQAAINAAATRNLAARLERAGYLGCHNAEAEAIVRELLADGLAPIRRPEPVPARGTGGTPAARAAALAATAQAIADARARRTTSHPDTPPPAASTRQLTKLAVALAADGIRDRADRLDWCSAMTGRDLRSTAELTRDEAHRLIDALEAPAPTHRQDTG